MASKQAYKGFGIIDFIVFIVTVVALFALAMAYLSPYINPNRVIWFSFFGLAAPAIYIFNVVLMLYWVIRWKTTALIVFVFLLVGMGNVSKFVKPGVSKHYQEEKVSGALKILSYNVGGFYGTENDMKINQSAKIAQFIEEADPDIICFQEYEVNGANRAVLDSTLANWKYKTTAFALGDGVGYGWGLAIYSKYPIRKPHHLNYPNSTNSSMWADIIVHRDTIRLYNNHLQTTQIDEKDRNFIASSEVLVDSARNDKAKGIARKLKRNFEVRADQVDSIKSFIHDGTPHVIVCGDFNDTPMSYTYHEMKGDLIDSFRRKGRGMVSTYRGLFGVFRIDYIFHSKDFETVSYEVIEHEWSDHNPVMVTLKIK